MKKLLLLMLILGPFKAFSQSYLIMDNGVILTTDKSGFVYDLGHFTYHEEVTRRGGQYFVEEGGVLVTIDENGLLHRKYEALPDKLKGRGMNYMISALGELFTIDRQGKTHYHQNDVFKYAANFGGNYFSVKSPTEDAGLEVYVVAQDGQYLKVDVETLSITDIAVFGGTYFMTNRGVVYTVAADGLVSVQAHERVGVITKRGGNYFTDSAGMIFTVTAEGNLLAPAVPVGFDATKITRTGSNYFLTSTGLFYVVDKDGNIFERKLPDQDLKDVRVISL